MCVSSFARQHGDATSDKNSKSDKTDKTKTGVTGNGSPNPNANAKNAGHGQPKGPRPSIVTTVEPTESQP